MILKNNYICAIDIGSSKLAACVARLHHRQIDKVFFESAASKGVKEGSIVNSIDLVGAVSSLIKSLSAKSGLNIKSLSANISGEDIVTKHSRAIVPLAERGNKVITASDTQKAMEQARILGSNLEEEIIHLIPSSYSIDSKANITNPIGLYSHGLEVDLFLVCARLSSVQGLSRVINQSGFELNNIFFSSLAAGSAVFSREHLSGHTVLCDIGSDITELLFYKDSVLYDIAVLPVGSDTMTSKLQEALSIPADLAEDIKRSHGAIGDSAQIAEDKEILVKKSNFYKPIKQKMVSEIISSSARQVCARIKEAVEKKLPFYQVNNFTAIGRAMLLEGFIETLESVLSIPVKIGRVNNPALIPALKEEDAVSGQRYLTYLVVMGIICEMLQEGRANPASVSTPNNPLVRAINKFKEAYQEYF